MAGRERRGALGSRRGARAAYPRKSIGACQSGEGRVDCGPARGCRTVSLANAADRLVYVGTYTRGASRGIYAFHFNESTGKLTSLGVAAESKNPSFLAEHPNHRFLYAVNEGGGTNSVSAFAIDAKSGKLTFLNEVPSGGNGPCHLALDHTGKWLGVANYG